MTAGQKLILHGTAVALRGHGDMMAAVLLRGKSGSGKSDLAFRLIGAGGTLVCDDQVVLERRRDKIIACAAQEIKGLLEIRGVGMLKYPTVEAPLWLVVSLVPREDVPRLPERESMDILGIAVTCLKLHAFDSSAPLKIIKAIELACNPDLLVE